ncbi:MAG: hypothetical protein KC415_06315 [Anaerolineales bacterium]|nr:hypothetical protein [Anaerolineales bacterium]MCB8991457.1 hypothetical protein [Ardenticatenaceae bacterium]MCB9003923.1 hypothetical protein [Ardenticatenaceae bacterium]
MKRMPFLFGLILLALLPLTFLHQLITASAAPNALRYVAPGGDCGGMSPCYAQVQTAVTAAAAGDEIRIAQGVYTGTNTASLFNGQTVMTQVVFISQSVQLHGGYTTADWENSDPAAHPTILDAEGNGRVISILGGGTITLTGLTLTGGYAEEGGGLYVENGFEQSITFTLQNSIVASNTAAHRGGGLDIRFSSARISGNQIVNNHALADFGGGGGISLLVNPGSFYNIDGNVIVNNHTAGTGGGIEFVGGLADELVVVEGNELVSNTAVYGGGLFAYTIQYLHVNNNRIQNNHSQQGGGIGFLSSFDISLENNLIQGNIVSAGDDGSAFINGQGGGLALDFVHPLTMTNNVIADNQAVGGDGISINTDSDVRMFHNTLARNQGSAIQVLGAQQPGDHCYSFTFTCTYLTMSNTLLISHAVGISITGLATSVQADGLLWHNTPVTTAVFTTANTILDIQNEYWGDPLFAVDGYHIMTGSAAIDRGIVTAVLTDIDGQTRPQGTAPDLGADELYPTSPTIRHTIYLPLLQK